MGACIKFLRVILCTVNFLFLLIGLLMLSFGVALKVSAKEILNLLSKAVDPNILKAIPEDVLSVVAIAMMVLGGVVTLISIFGFFGAIFKKLWLLIPYIIILILILLAEVALIIFVAGFPLTLQSLVQEQLRTTMISNFSTQDIQLTNDSISLPNNANGVIWASLQFSVKCCGISGPGDYSTLSATQRQENIPIIGTKILVVPISCCARNASSSTTIPTGLSDFKDFQGCVTATAVTAPSINQENCYRGIEKLITDSSQIPIGIAAGTIALQAVLVILASLLTHFIRKEY